MNDKSIVNFLVDEFQCRICFDLLDDPEPACAWGHIFCKECLRQLRRQSRRDNIPPRCPICRDSILWNAIRMRNNEGLMRTTKILEQLRQRVVWLPPRDIGLQTDLRMTRSTGQQIDSSSTRSAGQQTDLTSPKTSGQQTENSSSWDNGQELNAGLPENLTEILDEDSELSDKGGSHEPVVDREHDPWQGMVALRRWREEYANRTVPVDVSVKWVDEEQETEPDPRANRDVGELGYWIPLGPWMRRLVEKMPMLVSMCLLVLVGLRILIHGVYSDDG